ncbi:hypothetical protein HYDPIDRAFT_161048 [Hydnomerulius pinastri MD-312]|uniref:Uncharacterized protein n=1 Tax=Hydnomerulius pinastri MD-312 TaxID=994086 RepID=A0A0C9W2T8_9AGAM|nr:hypothetical protein HYDPIDRAFT_161048 [Hydnomerulius pinastri MD-312]
MSTYIQKVGAKLFEKHLEQYTPPDPLYEFYTDNRGRQRRKKRDVPPGLSSRDAKILKSVQRRAHYLDKGFNLCGFRFGWTFIIGIIPGAGDVADVTLNYVLVLRKARQADLPAWLVRRMLLNNAVSALSGLVPVAGDVVLALYKANSRNAMLLEEYLRIRGEEYLRLQAEKEVERTGGATGAASGIPKKDMEQMKPGSGMPNEARAGPAVGQSKSFASWRGKKQKTADQGRFVEDVNSGSGGESQRR